MMNISTFLKDQVASHQTPSVQYVFFDQEGIVHEERHGNTDVLNRHPVEASTRYHLYSITKTFTALAVLQLAQSGKISITHPVTTYLPDFPYNDTITIEQLLNHTSGIPNPLPLRWIHLANEHANFKRDAFFDSVFHAHPKLDFEPGEKFSYSNLGYVILGRVIENVFGQSFETFIYENIIDRCGISHTDLGFELNTHYHAKGYHKYWSLSNLLLSFLIDKKKFMGEKEEEWQPFHYFYNNGIAYGGLFGTMNGLVQYARALLRPDSVLLNDFYKAKLFAANSIGQRSTGMSYSWFTGQLKGHNYFTHAGGGGGYYVELRIYPELGTGSVIMFNRSGMRDERLLDKVDTSFITEYKNQPV